MTVRSVVVVLGLLGCVSALGGERRSSSEAPVTVQAWTENVKSVRESLARLEELDIVHVGDVIVKSPAASSNCYGPCADDPKDQAWLAEHAAQTLRLKAFVDAAEKAAAAPPAQWGTDVSASLDALKGLEIVHVQGVSMTRNCYGPCPDVLGKTQALADLAKGL